MSQQPDPLSTLPGFQVTIGKGKLSFDALRNDMIQNTLDIRTTYLPGDFSIDLNQTTLTLRVSAGPRFKVKLIPGLGALNLPGALGQPLAIGGHIVRPDHFASRMTANKSCSNLSDSTIFYKLHFVCHDSSSTKAASANE